MSNNYTRFSNTLVGLTEDEKEWITLLCDRLNMLSSGDAGGRAASTIAALAVKLHKETPGSIEYRNDDEDGSRVWFYADEVGDPYLVGMVVHHFFKEWRKKGKDLWFLQWADYSDQPRENEFGGGALIASKRGVQVMSTSAWIDEQLAKATKPLMHERPRSKKKT